MNDKTIDYPICPNCNRQLRPIPKAYKSNPAYRLLRKLQGTPFCRDSGLIRACLEWLVVEGDGKNVWRGVDFAWCSCDYKLMGARGSSFWQGIHYI